MINAKDARERSKDVFIETHKCEIDALMNKIQFGIESALKEGKDFTIVSIKDPTADTAVLNYVVETLNAVYGYNSNYIVYWEQLPYYNTTNAWGGATYPNTTQPKHLGYNFNINWKYDNSVNHQAKYSNDY